MSVDFDELSTDGVVSSSRELRNEADCKAFLASILQLHEKLPPELFDEKEHMYPQARQNLMKVATNLLSYIHLIFEHIEIEDVCLVSGRAGYIYHDKSDYDIFILVKPDEKVIDRKTFNQYFVSLGGIFSKLRIYFFSHEHFVDTSLIANPRLTGGVYSLIYDKWIQKPEKRRFNFSVDELYQSCVQKDLEINHAMCELPKIPPKDILSYDDAWQTIRHTNQYMDSMVTYKYDNPEKEYSRDYVTYRILKKMGILKKLMTYANTSIAEYYNDEIGNV